MSEQQIELLSAIEYKEIEKALWDLVRQYPRTDEDPDVIAEYDALGADKSLSMFILGGRYRKRDITGGFTAEINFSVAYKSSPKTSEQRIDRQAFVGRIMRWLENTKNLPLLTGGRVITKITASGAVPYVNHTGKDGSAVYAADAVLEYKKEEYDPLA